MALILGIETSCDETAAAVFDSSQQALLSTEVFSQIDLHKKYGGVVPEIASRSHLEKITPIVKIALADANVSLDDVDAFAVTTKPGLVGSLLIGMCFAKGLAWSKNKKLIGVNHLDGHIYSSLLNDDGTLNTDVQFPHICLLASGGNTALYLVKSMHEYELLGRTLDDAAGEAFDKVAKLIGLGYPGGPIIEKMAREGGLRDYFEYPRTKNKSKSYDFSFSGLKTAVLYDLVKRGVYDLKMGVIPGTITPELQQQVASSLLICIGDIFQSKLQYALKQHPEIMGFTFVGGVACNRYLREKLAAYCQNRDKFFVVPHPKYCGDNAAMIALVGAQKAEREEFDDFDLDVL